MIDRIVYLLVNKNNRYSLMHTQAQRYKVLAAGILNLMLLLGVARFAYTPLLPLMQEQAGLGFADSGWLAAYNYGGYLLGALVASLINDLELKDRLYRIGLVVGVLTTVAMGFTTDIWLWSLLRFLAGLSAAAGMLLGTGLILNWLIRHDHRPELGIHFIGVGLGITLCALVVNVMHDLLDWRQQWFLFAAIGSVLMVPAWRWLPRPDKSPLTHSGKAMLDNPPSAGFMRLFMAAYFCAGVGYVVSITFIVAIIEQQPALANQGALVFMVIGLAAAPACIIWDLVARRIGGLNALILTFIIQIGGILLPVLSGSLTAALLGSVLFGATFVGLVSLVLTMAGRYYPTRPAKMMGKMTLSYGVAQMLAPAITGLLAEQSGDYTAGVWLAAAIMMLGTLLMLALKALEKSQLRTAAAT